MTLLTERGQTVAVAESLTGGLLAASLVEVTGASVVFRGGIVAYATDLKSALLDVPAGLLERYGAVHADVASAMAEGVRRRLDATFGVATTGVAGPDPADGQPVGTVHIAASGQLSTVRQDAVPGWRPALDPGSDCPAVAVAATEHAGDSGDMTCQAREESERLQRYVRSEHAAISSRGLSVRPGTVEVSRQNGRGRECDDGPASSLAR